MNCPNCGVKLASISKFCPECGAKLTVQEEKKNKKAPDSIEELLVNIVQNYGGPELYKESNARKLAGLLKDFAGSNFQDEVRLLCHVVPEGFQEVLYNANNSSPEEKQGALAACKMKLIDNLFFSEAKAAEATNILVAGLCWNASQANVKTSSKNENKQKSGIVQKELLPKGIILNNDTSRVFQTLGEAVKIAKSGSEIKLGPGVYIEPDNSPLTEITKKITITGCTENIANKDFSELPIVVLNKEASCKITSDAVIEGVVFTSDENIHFNTLEDYLSKEPEDFSEMKATDDEEEKFGIDADDFYSLLLVEGNAELKNIAILKSGKYGVTFTSEKGSLTDSIVALSTDNNILFSRNTKTVMKNCLCAFSLYPGIYITNESKPKILDCKIQGNAQCGIHVCDNTEPEILTCRIFENKANGIVIQNESKPKISNCKIYDNKTEGEKYPGVVAKGSSEPEVTSCEIYGHLGYGIWIKENAKGSYKDCDIHDTEESGIDVCGTAEPEILTCRIFENKANGIVIKDESKPKISDCKIYDNKTEGERYPGVVAKGYSEPEITSCEIYGHLSYGLWIKENAKGSYKDCDIHNNKKNGIFIQDESKPKISNCKIYDNKTEGESYSGVSVEGMAEPEIYSCEIYGHLSCGIWITENAKGIYENCYIHDNAGAYVYNESNGKAAILNCGLNAYGFMSLWS